MNNDIFLEGKPVVIKKPDDDWLLKLVVLRRRLDEIAYGIDINKLLNHIDELTK